MILKTSGIPESGPNFTDWLQARSYGDLLPKRSILQNLSLEIKGIVVRIAKDGMETLNESNFANGVFVTHT